MNLIVTNNLSKQIKQLIVLKKDIKQNDIIMESITTIATDLMENAADDIAIRFINILELIWAYNKLVYNISKILKKIE